MTGIDGLFTQTALLGAVTYLLYQLRTLPQLVWALIKKKIIYTVHVEESSILYQYIETWLFFTASDKFRNVHAKLASDGRGPLGDNKPSSDNLNEDRIILQHYTDVFVMRYKGKRLLITKGREKFENASEISRAFFSNIVIEGWLAKRVINELLQEVLTYNQGLRHTEQFMYANTTWGDWEFFGEIKGKDIENVIVKQKWEVVSDIEEFLQKEDWYLKRGLMYKRGYLFHGRPGNGKTSLSLALAKRFNRHIYFLNLNDLTKDADLYKVFSRLTTKAVLVLEDVDAAQAKRKEGESKISFSALLNCIDGAFSKHGLILIMTTNHVENIDPALIRAGRIDMKIEIDNPDCQRVQEYLELFYDQELQIGTLAKDLSMADVQEICLRNKNSVEVAVETISGVEAIGLRTKLVINIEHMVETEEGLIVPEPEPESKEKPYVVISSAFSEKQSRSEFEHYEDDSDIKLINL